MKQKNASINEYYCVIEKYNKSIKEVQNSILTGIAELFPAKIFLDAIKEEVKDAERKIYKSTVFSQSL